MFSDLVCLQISCVCEAVKPFSREQRMEASLGGNVGAVSLMRTEPYHGALPALGPLTTVPQVKG